jgi:cytochrome c553
VPTLKRARGTPALIVLAWAVAATVPGSAQGAAPPSEELAAALKQRADVAHGKELFETCAACHGRNGAGQSDGTVPAIAAQPVPFIAAQLVAFRNAKRQDERMEHFANEHHLVGAHDIADVATYISSLRPIHALEHGDGQHRAQGAKLYHSECAPCHGPAGEGTRHTSYPRLAGQHYEYLLRQLRGEEADQRPDFVAQHSRLLRGYSETDLVGIADYLARLGR